MRHPRRRVSPECIDHQAAVRTACQMIDGFQDRHVRLAFADSFDTLAAADQECIALLFGHALQKLSQEAGLSNVEVIPDDMLTAGGQYDVVNLDMTIGPEHIRHAHALLRSGGFLACYTPFIEHMSLVLETAEGMFTEVHAHEYIEREMTRTQRGTRPSTRVCHSGYITIARK